MNDKRIRKLLKEDKELARVNEELNEKWLKECFEITIGKRELTSKMIREKIEWIDILAELSNPGKKNE